MKKTWSISTTVRNPERIRDFLRILSEMEGEEWTRLNQKKFQVRLIQHKVYGYGEVQFLNTLSPEHLQLMKNPDSLTYEQAEEILDAKNYVGGGDMRGRQSFNPIEKMGLAILDENNTVRISSFGRYFLKEDFDLGNVFFRSFLKWQLPNLFSRDFRAADGYAIKPFIATLHLIKEVNRLWQDIGNNPVGISKQEFTIFVPTLINFGAITKTARKIIEFRNEKETAEDAVTFVKEYHHNHISEFMNSRNATTIKRTVHNTIEYTDNIIRYFRLTRYLHIRGNGFYIDLEPRRMIEIDSILATDNASPEVFADVTEYAAYLADIEQPVLPWETDMELRNITTTLTDDVRGLVSDLKTKGVIIPNFKFRNIPTLNREDLKAYAESLRSYRRKLQELEIHFESQNTDKIREYIGALRNIHRSSNKKSVELEKLATLSINALNDAIEIKPNYPVGDDNEPTFTAPAGKPDIECFYQSFNSVCEVTMLSDRSQWYNEGQPVMRHIRDFKEGYPDKEVYCLFVAPRLHQDTIETFWVSVKHGYRGETQKIIPLSITQMIRLLEILIEVKESGRKLEHGKLSALYEEILAITKEVDDSAEWIARIPAAIDAWREEILAR
ncbi:MAG TPA: AlwI family type II restriction endonuclease [Candidatus Paceibacterota bacterium]|nr:AlwI family type II restriction endonuclease [Candidatus Paceibacterota bacterium]